MNARKFQQLCVRIAATVNKTHRIRSGGVDAEQVAFVASGRERTVSHPIIMAICAELKLNGIDIP